MNVKKIEIGHWLGIEELSFDLGKVTIVQGRNGSGKSSILNAISSALGGAKQAELLLQNGAEQGRAVLVFDDGMTVERRVGKGEGLKVIHPDWGPVAKPQTVLDGLVDKRSLNPAHFLLPMRAKDRTKLLLEVVDLHVTPEEIAIAMSAALGEDVTIDVPLEGLDLIEYCRKLVYDQRTGTNATAEDKRRAVKELGDSLPAAADLDIDYEAELATVEAVIDSEQQRYVEEARAIESEANERLLAINQACKADLDAMAAKYSADRQAILAELARLDGAYDKATDARQLDALNAANPINVERAARIDQANAQHAETITAAKERRATLAARAQDITKHRNTAKYLASLSIQANELEEKARRETATIEALDRLKVEKMSQLPINGVDIRNGELYVDDVPFDFVNRARQVEIAFALAKLRMGALKLICVDNLECLDSETFHAFVQQGASDPDLQLFVTRVADGDLEIITTDGEVPA